MCTTGACQRVINHAMTTNASSAIRAHVTRDRGITVHPSS